MTTYGTLGRRGAHGSGGRGVGMTDSDSIAVRFSPRPRGLPNLCDNCVFNAFTQALAAMMAATGHHCSDVVPGPLGELLQWASSSAYVPDDDHQLTFPSKIPVDDDALFDVIEDVQMDGRQQVTLLSVRSMLHQWALDDLFAVTQKWFSTTITVMPVKADSASTETVAAICYDNSAGIANHVIAFVRHHSSWWKIDDDIVTFLGEREPVQMKFSRIRFNV